MRDLTKPIPVGPHSEFEHTWSWIYFHGERLENLVNARREELGHAWEAPDLVGSDLALEHLDDGIHAVDLGDENLLLFLWSVDCRYEFGEFQGRRKGLIVTMGGTKGEREAYAYARQAYEQKKVCL